MMPLQRACGAESQVRNKLSNGPLRAQSNEKSEYSATWGRRNMPGVCWYPAKYTGHAVNQGGTADSVYSSLTEKIFCRGRFFMERRLGENLVTVVFYFRLQKST